MILLSSCFDTKGTFLSSLVSAFLCVAGCSIQAEAQSGKAKISEYQHSFKTYGFSDPDDIPILTSNPKIYPYHKYDGYSQEGVTKEWKVVKLENDYIEVYILPEVGGKVWGAIEKSTGEEFIYRNEVMKFRNISMRGPWTSGGIEFNFGIIGHHPSTATPVDYAIRENDDGSVSCTVGNIDLPSRTQWRVEIYLAPEKAYFETRVLWYNPTHNTQSYYNWMTGAAVASDDLEFFCPGNQYVGHPGDAHPWPRDDEGRNLQLYGENNFGPSKSYHVVGEYNDFFGGYYHKRNFGFGHWSPYEEMPGQKLWLWALSRAGGIWEDLLTDNDGQYIEFQAGRLFNQFSPGRVSTPITQTDFEPGRADLWREIWFPVKDIGGLSDVSTKGILHVQESGDSMVIGINALEKSQGILRVTDAKSNEVATYKVELNPMGVKSVKIKKPMGDFSVEVAEMDLHLGTKNNLQLDRPFNSTREKEKVAPTALSYFREASEEVEFRNYSDAEMLLKKCLEIDPNYIDALSLLADLKLRSAHYADGLLYARAALKIDTYDPEANFNAAKLYLARHDDINALECFGWAARSLKYRADAYTAMAEIYMSLVQLDQATRYARNALDFNRYNLRARMVLTIAARLSGNVSAAVAQISTLRAIDPLNHFAKMEQYLISKHEGDKQAFLASHQSEIKYQTFLELAIAYDNLGRKEEALAVLALAPSQPMIYLWQAYLTHEIDALNSDKYLKVASELPAEKVFPYRTETLPVLQWASEKNSAWQLQYYLALNNWGLGRNKEALEILNSLGEAIDYAPFYISRAKLRRDFGQDEQADLEHALQIDKNNWRSWEELIGLYKKNGDNEKYLLATTEALQKIPDNYVIEMLHAGALLESENYLAAIELLKGVHVLPYEGASLGRKLWEEANLAGAKDFMIKGDYNKSIELLQASQDWPENLGVGKPYNPDHRLSDYLLYKCFSFLKDEKMAAKYKETIKKYNVDIEGRPDLNDLLNLKLADSEDARAQFLQKRDQADTGVVRNYIQAFAAGDKDKMDKIEKEHENMFSGITAEVLKFALDL